MWLCGRSSEKNALGARPGIRASGKRSSNAAVCGQLDHRSIGPPILPQEAGRPVQRSIKRRPVVLRRAGVKLDIGPQRIARCRQQRGKFRSDRSGACLKLSKPGEVLPIKKLIGGQERI